jgi:hypothetical protein
MPFGSSRRAAQWQRRPRASLNALPCPNGGEAAIDKERFVNARAEDYWTLRERFEQGEIEIDPDDDKLAAQLGSIKWGIDSDQGVVTGRGTISATLLRREHFH